MGRKEKKRVNNRKPHESILNDNNDDFEANNNNIPTNLNENNDWNKSTQTNNKIIKKSIVSIISRENCNSSCLDKSFV